MKTPPVPSREGERIETLRRHAILDTPPEQVFDDAVKLAALICRTPTAMVSFVDRDREWFKAKLGADLPEGPRADSFCAHAILGKDLFEVPDTREDERFHDNPQVTGDPLVGCYFLQGYLAGAVSALFGRRNLVCREIACRAKGAPACEFELRTVPSVG